MMDTLDIGPTPCEERCEQVGTDGYDPTLSKLECRVFIKQIQRICGDPPDGARLVVTNDVHEAGTYHEVGVRHDNTREAIEYAYKCEGQCIEHWDLEALIELAEKSPKHNELLFQRTKEEFYLGVKCGSHIVN
jgi:hypothetical protein